jgi:hypothetical protein
MALVATLTKGAAMRVVAAVAAKAGRRCRDFRGVPLCVTGVALHANMFAGELELGFAVVIEAPESPTVGVVAALALRSNASFVMRIFVTNRAELGRVVVGRCAMAFLAGHRSM